MVEKLIDEGINMTGKLLESGKKTIESGLKKAWSILEAADEKTLASQALSPKAIGAIQGKLPEKGA